MPEEATNPLARTALLPPATDSLTPLTTAIRWGTLVIGILLGVASGHRNVVFGGAGLLVYTVLRTVQPLPPAERPRSRQVALFFELALITGIVAATGGWSSPFVACIVTPVIAAGFSQGFIAALEFSLAAGVAIGISHYFGENSDIRTTAQWSTAITSMGLVAAYGRRLSTESEKRVLAFSERRLLSEANALLHQLAYVAQTLPSSLDLGVTLESTLKALKRAFDADIAAVLLHDNPSDTWSVAAAEGMRNTDSVKGGSLPSGPAQALSADEPILLPLEDAGSGLAAMSSHGLYASLRVGNEVVGILAVESRQGDSILRGGITRMAEIAAQAELTIDNARSFNRLRTVGADEERTRIARDLHDRVGQSLAYLAFELDRLKSTDPARLPQELDQLRQDVRRVVGEVRNTLYDLRTDVTDEEDIVSTLADFLDRVGERSSLRTVFRHDARVRPPLPQERELWRIAQEAITNAERHSGAECISVLWQSDESGVVLEVADDGKGFTTSTSHRSDTYGVLGMRERADAVGAMLEIDSNRNKGTVVRCKLGAL